MLLPTDAASQEPVVGSAQRVVVVRHVTQSYSMVSISTRLLAHPDFELEGSARSVVQIEGVLPEAAP